MHSYYYYHYFLYIKLSSARIPTQYVFFKWNVNHQQVSSLFFVIPNNDVTGAIGSTTTRLSHTFFIHEVIVRRVVIDRRHVLLIPSVAITEITKIGFELPDGIPSRRSVLNCADGIPSPRGKSAGTKLGLTPRGKSAGTKLGPAKIGWNKTSGQRKRGKSAGSKLGPVKLGWNKTSGQRKRGKSAGTKLGLTPRGKSAGTKLGLIP